MSDKIIGRTVLWCIGDVEYPCELKFGGNGGGYCLKDKDTGKIHAEFDDNVYQQLRQEGSAPNMELI